MKLLNIPEIAATEWLLNRTHPVSHTFEDILFGLKISSNIADELFLKSHQKEKWEECPVPHKGFFFLFFYPKGNSEIQMFAVYRSRRGYGISSDEEGVLCELGSLKDLQKHPIFFLPLATRFTLGGLHRIARLAVFGVNRVSGADYWEICSSVINVQHEVLGDVYMVSSWNR